MSTPGFTFCGKFSGKGESAARWLKSFNHELVPLKESGKLTPKAYLDYLDLLLQLDAAKWAESNPEAVRLLATEEPTQAMVDQFVSLLKQRFPAEAVEEIPVTFDAELAELRQQSAETITSYYTRTTSLMHKYGARDRSPLVILSLAEGSLLDTFLRTWIRGLTDASIKRKCAESMGTPDRSLRMLYDVAETARRVNLEIQKLFEEEAKENELQFYKEIAQRNMPRTQIDALRASYQTSREPQHQQFQSWSYRSDPPHPVPGNPATQDSPKPSQQYHQQDHTTQAQPQVLAQNPNRGNAGRNSNPGTNTSRLRPQQPVPKDLPDRSTSKNPWINGTLYWAFAKDGLLCVKCGTKGHSATKCNGMSLPAWEQSYLRMIVFGDNPQANFASVGFGEFDGSVRPYGTVLPKTSSAIIPVPASSASSNTGQLTPTSSIESYVSPNSHSVQFGVAGLSLSRAHSESKVAQAESFLGEGSGPNKRAHFDDDPEQSQKRLEKLPERPQSVPAPQQAAPRLQPQIPSFQRPAGTQMPASQSIPQQPATQANPPVPQQPSAAVDPGTSFQGTPFQYHQFQPATEEDRPKRKGKKRVGKKAEPQPLVGLFNGTQYESPVSVREVLQSTKVDMTWMDLVAWSPAVCKELKRLCTRVPKKRTPKPSTEAPRQQPQQQQAGVPQFNFQPMQNFPQPIPAYMMPQQTFQPIPMTGAYQNNPNLAPGQSQQSTSISSFNVGAATAVEAEKETRFLSTLVGVDKAFRVPATVRKPDGVEVKIDKRQTQADQGSDMNVISTGMVRFLGLTTHSLSEIGFKGLSMRTADHRDTILEYWVWLHIGVEGVWRDIRCFVAPEVVSVTESGRSEYLSLILGIPWLYSVDASISIRLSTIFIGDRSIGEQVRGVVGPELVFCKDHNLLMYPKSAMVATKASSKTYPKATVEEVDSSDSSESSDSGDDLSDVEEIPRDFQ